MGQLTDLRVKNAEHRAKEYLLADGDGLYLRVRQTRKVWLYRYMHDGKDIKLTLGRYPVVSLAAPGNRLAISLYHCKGAGGPVSGERVDDVYELAGQSVKSARFQRKDDLLRHVDRRTQVRRNRGHSPLLVGGRDDALDLIRSYDPISITLTVYAVQPGLSAGGLTENVRAVMAAANDSLTSQGVDLRWLISA